jgi:hypothetical protein
MADVMRLPGLGPVIGGQARYQLTLMLRTPRTLLGGLLLSVRFFRWDPHRPRHARATGAGNPGPFGMK